MAIIIENFECTDSPKVQQTKNDIDKQKYLKFLLEKGIEECAGIAMAHRSLKKTIRKFCFKCRYRYKSYRISRK